ncbi:MAG: M1 family metallopeptidase, partial [Planctomycetota bacterium]|nr:M1 family metallopeptidase [Planctomycetota bacterium]
MPTCARPFALLVVFALFGLAWFELAVPARADEPAPRPLDATTRDFDQLHADIQVQPDLAAGTIAGRVTHRVAALVEGLASVRLHAQDMQIRRVTDASGAVLPHTHEKDILTISLAAPLALAAETTLLVEYLATPRRGMYFHRPTAAHPETPWFMYSQGQGTDNRRWIPCYDEPDDRLSWTLAVTVDEGFQSVSNGVLEHSTPHANGTHEDVWDFKGRAPTYLISLIVGKLETVQQRHGDVQLDFSAPPGQREALETSLAETGAMLDFFGAYLQAPYPWPRYAQTYVWDFLYGGMENVTATTLNMRALHTEAIRPNYRSEGLVAHELAHMWFGDLLTCRTWSHIWLNEGFATYFTDLFFEHRYGVDEFLVRRRSQNRGYMDGTPKASELSLERDPRGDLPLELFGGKQYSRGAAILHVLRRHIGDETFRDSIRAYVARHRDQTVTSEDLRTVTEAVAGEDLGWFFDQWVYGLGYPKLDVRYDAETKQLIVRQTQAQAGGQGLFRLRVPVRWGPDGPVHTYTIHQERHAFPMEAGADFVRFGVGGDLLMDVTLHQSPAAWTAALAHDPDVTGRLDATAALETFGPIATSPLAQALAQDSSFAVREAAARVLGRLDGPGTAEALLTGASDPDSRVRAAAMTALGAKNRRAAGAAVVRAAREETHP